MDWFEDLNKFDIALLTNEGVFVLTVLSILLLSKVKDGLKSRVLITSRLMIAQSLATGVVVMLGSLRVMPSKVGIVTYWSLRNSNLKCNVENMTAYNIGMPLFLLLTGISCYLGAYLNFRKKYIARNQVFIIVFAILMFAVALFLGGIALYPDHLCSDPFGGTLFQVLLIVSQSSSVLLIGIQVIFVIVFTCRLGSTTRRSSSNEMFQRMIPSFLMKVTGVSTMVQDDGSKVASAVMEQESARIKDAKRILKFVLENNFLTSAFMMIFELMLGVQTRKMALRTQDLVLSRTKRYLLWCLVHYDNFVEISWRVVHLVFLSLGAIFLLRRFIHKNEFFDSNSYDDWTSLSVQDQENSNLCWVSTYLREPQTQSILYDQSIWNRTEEMRLTDLEGQSFVPSHRCITVRTPVYLWMSLASLVLTVFSAILFRLIHAMNRWSSKIESESTHSCARFLRLGLVVPAILMMPFVVYALTIEIQDGTRVEALECHDCVETSPMFNQSKCYESRCVPDGAVGPQNITNIRDDVTFIGADYFLAVQILLGAVLLQILGALIYLCWRRSCAARSGDGKESRFFGIELSRFTRQKSEVPSDDQGVNCSAVDEFEAQDIQTRNHIREIAARAKALSVEGHILKEAAGEQFIRSFMDLLEAEHDYGDVLHAMVMHLLPAIHKYSKASSSTENGRTSRINSTVRRVMLSLGESRQVTLSISSMNALHVTHIHFVKRLSNVMKTIINGAMSRTPKMSMMKRKKSKKLLKRLGSHADRLRIRKIESQNDVQGSPIKTAASSIDIEIGMKDIEEEEDEEAKEQLQEDEKQQENQHFSIARGIEDADLTEIASAIADLADLLSLYTNLCLHAHHASILIERARCSEKSVDKIFCDVELKMRDLNTRNFVDDDDDEIPSIKDMFARPLERLLQMTKQIESLRNVIVLLRGYFHGTKLEKRTAVASVAMSKAVTHWRKCYEQLQENVKRGTKWLELRHIQTRFLSTVSCLSRHRTLTAYSPELYLFANQIVVRSFLFSDAILFGIDRNSVKENGECMYNLQPYQLFLIRGKKNMESKSKSPTSKDIAIASSANGVTGKIVDAQLIDLSKNQRVSNGCCDCIWYFCVDVFKYIYNILLYIVIGFICCSGNYLAEKNKIHRYRVRLICEGNSVIELRLGKDDETVKWYESLSNNLRKRNFIARGGLAPKKPAVLQRLASHGDIDDDDEDVGYNASSKRKKRQDDQLLGQDGGENSSKIENGDKEENIDEEERMEAERIRHFKELVSSEQKYVKSLNTLYEICIQPLLDIVYRPPQSPNLRLLPRSIHLIDMLTSGTNFPLSKACDKVKSARATVAISSLEIILTIHRKFLQDLQQINHRKKGWIVGRTLLGIVPLFRMYEFYSAVQRSFIRILDDEAFRSLREKWSDHPRCNMLDIESFLIQPIQRLPRYSLLIRDIFKSTPRHHRDFKILARAQGKMEMLLSYIDESAKS